MSLSLRMVATVGVVVVVDDDGATDFPVELTEELPLLLLTKLLPMLSFFAGVVSHLSLFLANAAVVVDEVEEEEVQGLTDVVFVVVVVAIFAALST